MRRDWLARSERNNSGMLLTDPCGPGVEDGQQRVRAKAEGDDTIAVIRLLEG